jgi:hypothetical protein
MELLGIILSVPVAFACCMVYCLLLAKVICKFRRLSYVLKTFSTFVLAGFALELVFLITIGIVRSRAFWGAGFYVIHIILFFLGPPALANVLLLRNGTRMRSLWYIAGFLCTVFAFILVLLQYTVSESLYGIDGEGGPYSSAPPCDRKLRSAFLRVNPLT